MPPVKDGRKRKLPPSSSICVNSSDAHSSQAKTNPQHQQHHELSIYRYNRINFDELAQGFPDFQAAWASIKRKRKQSRKGSSSFSSYVDFEFNSSLSRALLERDFKLCIPSLPVGHLCPPVPNRLNYVCWIRELLDSFNDATSFSYNCIDIGTGSSCIYPLLICAARHPAKDKQLFDKRYTVFASEIDPRSVESASINVSANDLQNRIKVVSIRNEIVEQVKGPLQQTLLSIKGEPYFDFVMTNPPFYLSEDEAKVKRRDGRCRTDLTLSEGVYEGGGELGFVMDIFDNSLIIRDKVRWYSAMFSKKSNATEMERHARNFGLEWCNVKLSSFVQGQTTRWGVAWTFYHIPDYAPGNLDLLLHTFSLIC